MELDWRQVFIRKRGLFVLEFRELFGLSLRYAYHKTPEVNVVWSTQILASLSTCAPLKTHQ
jgi:hypothetical protein